MKRYLKWGAAGIVTLAVVGFLGFLYVMPPFFLIPPEQFGEDMRKAAPPVDEVADPAVRALAERGRQIVMNTGCTGCHAANGPQGPDLTRYLAGGGVRIASHGGVYVSRNLTPDPETGLAGRSDEEVKRVLRSGTFPDGHVAPYTTMPWAAFTHLTEEDRHAVVTYLRHLPAVRQRIPDPSFTPADLPDGAVEGVYALKDYSIR